MSNKVCTDWSSQATIGLLVSSGLERSPQRDIGTYLIKNATVTPFWAAGQRRVADAGDVSMMAAIVGTPVPFDNEVHRSLM